MFVGDQTGKAEDAGNLYVELFENSKVVGIEHWGPDEAGDGVKQARFELAGRPFTAMDGGDMHDFSFTPAVSLTVEFDDEQRLEKAFERLSDGGAVLMPLGDYPFSPKFAWINDGFGVSWQLMLRSDG